ncbi:hypothetical protein [Spirosoma spitsbergense]|nr:hypothetical protein [Spirosoma spitsbergense]
MKIHFFTQADNQPIIAPPPAAEKPRPATTERVRAAQIKLLETVFGKQKL